MRARCSAHCYFPNPLGIVSCSNSDLAVSSHCTKAFPRGEGGRAKRGRMREGGRTVKRSRRLVFYIRSVVQLLQMHIKTEHIAIPHQSKIKIFDSFPPGEALGAPAPQQLATKSEFDAQQEQYRAGHLRAKSRLRWLRSETRLRAQRAVTKRIATPLSGVPLQIRSRRGPCGTVEFAAEIAQGIEAAFFRRLRDRVVAGL